MGFRDVRVSCIVRGGADDGVSLLLLWFIDIFDDIITGEERRKEGRKRREEKRRGEEEEGLEWEEWAGDIWRKRERD